ncbi:MAG: hypothetical protein ABFS86_10450 [Planctomycetota bacterium]
MLSLNSPINAADIYTAKALAPGHPVFKLDGFGDDRGKIDSVVVKLETNQSSANVQAAAMIMTVVDRNARTEALKPLEVGQLKLWAQGGEVPDVDAFQTALDLARQLEIPGAWVKMDVKRLTMLDGAVKKRLDPANPDKADVRLIARALKKHGGLEKLGEIIAADLFNGNTDRFGPPFELQPGRGPGGIPLDAIYNVGNVFVACDGKGRGSPIGLDNYDPASEWKDLNNGDIDPNRWGGMLLHPRRKADREQYAGLIVSDLEALLGPRNRKFSLSSKNRLGSGRKRRIRNGMGSGAKKLKRALQRWQRTSPSGRLKAGVTAKMAALGW